MKRCICPEQDQYAESYADTLFHHPPPAKHPSKSQAGAKRGFEMACTESRKNFNTVDFVPAPLFKHFNFAGASGSVESSTLGYQFLADHNVPSYTLRPYGNSYTPLPPSPSSSPETERTNQEPSEVFIFYKNYKRILYYSN